jgi:hypothetical protein
MNRRPLGVSIICWIIIVLSIISLVSTILMISTPERMAVIVAQSKVSPKLLHYNIIASLVSVVINFILAICMLNGMNWARHVYLIFNGVIYIAALILFTPKLPVLIAIVIFLIFLYFLYNQPANDFFTGKTAGPEPHEDVQ